MTVTTLKLASGAGETFGVDDLAIAWACSGGFWEREGLQIEWTPVRGGVNAAKAVLAKDVVAGYGTWLPAVKMASAGEPIQVLVSMALALAQNLVVNKEKIKSKDDLKGKKWSVDGIGALSHSLGLLICKGLGIAPEDIEWVVSGPPPERKKALLEGSADCSLLRVEEAIALERDYPELLAKLLGFEEIHPLAPVQPHGILSVRSDWAAEHPDECKSLVKGLILASRDLHESVDSFKKAVRDHVKHVTVTDEDIESIWTQEHDAKSFAVNGGFGSAHWEANFQMYASVNNGAVPEDFHKVSVPGCVASVVEEIGAHKSHDPAPAVAK